MKAPLLFLLACAAVLAMGARANSPGEPEPLVQKVQDYVQKASSMAKSALGAVRESDAAQHARRWLEDNAELVKQRVAWMKEQLQELWRRARAV